MSSPLFTQTGPDAWELSPVGRQYAAELLQECARDEDRSDVDRVVFAHLSADWQAWVDALAVQAEMRVSPPAA